jgi:hypothetical protein
MISLDTHSLSLVGLQTDDLRDTGYDSKKNKQGWR